MGLILLLMGLVLSRLRLLFCLCLLLLPVAAPAADADSDLGRLEALALPKKEGAFKLHYSPSAQAEAEVYAATLERAFAWYRARIEWPRPIVMAVLNSADWAKVSQRIPYPS
ncbi:MAG: hypothetical protein ABI399_02175, partial [Bauldia sp.]